MSIQIKNSNKYRLQLLFTLTKSIIKVGGS